MVQVEYAFLSINMTYQDILELHIYNGLFGAHVALIMRRLRRWCHYYENDTMQLISCSATIRHADEVTQHIQHDWNQSFKSVYYST